jgi:lysophospholipase L1-like esterase
MKKTLTILCIALLIAISGDIIGYLYVYKAFDKYNDSRLDPIGLNFRDRLKIRYTPYDFVVIGDSHAQNWDVHGSGDLNLGIASQTSSQIRLRSDIYTEKLSGRTLAIVAGGNDIKSISTNKNRKDQIVKNCLNNIRKIVDNHKGKFEEIYLLTIPPVFRLPFEYRTLHSKELDEAHIEINEGIRRIAKESNVQLLDSYEILLPLLKKRKLSGDGIHMNSTAYGILEEELENMRVPTGKGGRFQ